MSVNRYNASTGELTSLATGSRTWVGTREAYDQAKQAGTLPNNCLIAITDDEDDTFTDQVTKDDPRAVTSGGVYDASLAFRPDLWQYNVEYNFGNGLYGKKWTGDAPVGGGTIYPDTITGITGIIGYGGDVHMGTGHNIHTFPYTPGNPDVWGTNLFYNTNNSKFNMTFGSGYFAGNVYHVWVLYTK